jgi:hypothetical protein
VTCRLTSETDFPGFVADPRAEEWEAFRAHLPSCDECSSELKRWSELEATLREASPEASSAHPTPERIVLFQRSPTDLEPEERARLEMHVKGCAPCRTELAALALSGFARPIEDPIPQPRPANPAQAALEWLREKLTGGLPAPALAAVAFALLALPIGALIWTVGSDSDDPGPSVAKRPERSLPDGSGETPPPPLVLASIEPPTLRLPTDVAGPGRIEIVLRAPGEALPLLMALAPDHPGLATTRGATLRWWSADPADRAVRLAVMRELGDEPLFEARVDGPTHAGFHSLSLVENGVTLEPGVDYRWIVSFVDDAGDSIGGVKGGTIRVVDPDASLASILGDSGEAERGTLYAASGYWYDALDFYSAWIDQHPDEASVARAHRRALLGQVGLEVADDADLPPVPR